MWRIAQHLLREPHIAPKRRALPISDRVAVGSSGMRDFAMSPGIEWSAAEIMALPLLSPMPNNYRWHRNVDEDAVVAGQAQVAEHPLARIVGAVLDEIAWLYIARGCQWWTALDHVGRFFSDHNDCCINISGSEIRHNRRINYAQAC